MEKERLEDQERYKLIFGTADFEFKKRKSTSGAASSMTVNTITNAAQATAMGATFSRSTARRQSKTQRTAFRHSNSQISSSAAGNVNSKSKAAKDESTLDGTSDIQSLTVREDFTSQNSTIVI